MLYDDGKMRSRKRWPFTCQKVTFYKPICGLLQAKRRHIGKCLIAGAFLRGGRPPRLRPCEGRAGRKPCGDVSRSVLPAKVSPAGWQPCVPLLYVAVVM